MNATTCSFSFRVVFPYIRTICCCDGAGRLGPDTVSQEVAVDVY